MSGCPFHAALRPVKPEPLRGKAGWLKLFFKKRRSWMDGLYERSYRMKMGEIKLPGIHLYMVNQPDLVRRVMIDEVAEFPKHHMMGDILEPLLGESIFTTNGKQWRKQRDMLNPSFDMVRVQHVFSLMHDAAKEMMQRFAVQEGAADIDVDHEMTYVTADIIFRTILSVSIEQSDAKKIFDAFVVFQRESPKAVMKRVFSIPDWVPLNRLSDRRRFEAGEEIRAALERVIRPRYDAVLSDSGGGTEQDILSSILQAVDPDTGERFSFKEIVDQVAMLFLAGHETSASALTWSLYLLALYPDVQEKMHAEVEEALAQEEMGVSVLRRMDLVRDVFRESLRLYPPVGFFARETVQETKMRDKNLDTGALVVVAPWLIHRHEDYWDKPDDFDPWRYAKDRMKLPLRDAFLPFGMGPRVCIGLAFAMQEAALILALLVRQYRFSMVPGFTPDPVGRITIRSENGMRLVVRRREGDPK